MPYLGDYVGHLIAEITNARMQADLQSVHIADIYAAHPYLKYLPVPHFRLPQVTLDVPVSIQDVAEGAPAGGGSTIDAAKSKESLSQLVSQHLQRSGIKLKETERQQILRSVQEKHDILFSPKAVPLSTTDVAEQLTNTVVQSLKQFSTSDRIAEVGKGLRSAARVELLNLRQPLNRLKVGVTTPELAQVTDRNLLATIHLSISEEAVEWSVEDTKGETTRRLIPE
jgi:hypothetical protein